LNKTAAGVLVALLLAAPLAHAQTAADKKILRVCADPNSMPFSNDKGEGLENRIAKMFADELGWTLEYYFFPQRMAFLRNTLRAKAENGEDGFKCDLVTGSSPDPEGATATKPWYRSTWAMVFPEGMGLDSVRSPDDLLKLPPELLGRLRFGVFAKSPAADWIMRAGLEKQMVPFQHMVGDPKAYPGQIIDQSLANGDVDIAFAWGPVAGYYAKQVTSKKLRVVPMRPAESITTDFSIAMAVRYREPEWKARIEDFLQRRKPDIDKVLTDYGVPMVQEDGSVLISGERFTR